MFRITARTVLELGSELISSDIIAFYELVKNGFDAKTKTGVDIRFDIALPRRAYLKLQEILAEGGQLSELKAQASDAILTTASPEAKAGFSSAIDAANSVADLQKRLREAQRIFNTITVADTGAGMSFKELEQNFLVIGTASRKKEVEAALASGALNSPYLGEKGIGRLSAMRLGEKLRVETTKAGETHSSILDIDWTAFGDIDAMLDQIEVAPQRGAKKISPATSGTSIIISDLTENWTESRVKEMADYDFARLSDPFADAKKRPRIAIFWNGERVSIPMMQAALLDAAHAKVSGKYEIVKGKPVLTCTVEAIDLGYEHPKETETVRLTVEDLEAAIVGKDRDIEDSALVTVGPFSFEAHWFNRRRLGKIDGLGEQRAVRDLQEQWSGILLFRDRFRVFPYGEDEDDWLELDRKALRRSGYTLNKTQFIGRVSITRTGNPMLVDQTNREGLRVTPEQQVLLQVVRYAVQDRLGQFLNSMERQYKHQKLDLGDAQVRVERLEDRAKTAIGKLRKLTPPEGDPAIEDLQQTLFEFAEFAASARQRISEVEQESRQLIEMAGVGLMVEVVAHELARASESALKALESLKGKEVPEKLRAQFVTLQAEMKTISKRVRVLDPLSISGRQRAEIFALEELVRDTCEAHESQFKRHNVEIKYDFPKKSVRIRAVKGMVVQILENLISNAIYWLDSRAERDRSFRPAITVAVDSGPPTVTFEDNGRGITPEHRDQIFKAFFSLKESRRRRGLGLFIAREAAEHNGGTLILDDKADPKTGRFHRFILELPESVEQ